MTADERHGVFGLRYSVTVSSFGDPVPGATAVPLGGTHVYHFRQWGGLLWADGEQFIAHRGGAWSGRTGRRPALATESAGRVIPRVVLSVAVGGSFGGRGLRGVESLLAELASCTDAAAYLASQDRAAVVARRRYDELEDAAYDAPDPRHRREGLHLVAHLGREGCQTVLRHSWLADPDSAVRACAEALLYRVIVRDRVRASGEMDEAGFAAYLHSVREQSAQRWVARHAKPGSVLNPPADTAAGPPPATG